jgi:hypothetical protein
MPLHDTRRKPLLAAVEKFILPFLATAQKCGTRKGLSGASVWIDDAGTLHRRLLLVDVSHFRLIMR